MRRVGVFGVVLLALAVAGCGGGGSKSGGSSSSEHPLGAQVVVQHTEIGATGSNAPHTTLGIAVLAVRKGTQQELKAGGYQIDAKDQSKTPYYVDVRYANKGASAIKRNLGVGLEDEDGNLISEVTIFDFGGKPFAKCPHVAEGELKPGESYKACSLFLVPPGKKPSRVSFLPYDPKQATDFVYWKVS